MVVKRKYKIRSCCQSDVGLVRKTNEDFWAQLPEEGFYVVADGMGGHRAGEVASKEAVQYMCSAIKKLLSPKQDRRHLDELTQSVTKVIESANKWVHKLGKSQQSYKGMGTTLCSALFQDGRIIYSHVGDSRIYRFRNKTLQQLTMDHSIHGELVKKGAFQQTEIEVSSYTKRLTRAVGTETYVKPDIGIELVQPRDIYLLCSDGLTDLVPDQTIEKILKSSSDLDYATHRLIEMAKSRGGNDNITILLLEVNETHLSGQQRNDHSRP